MSSYTPSRFGGNGQPQGQSSAATGHDNTRNRHFEAYSDQTESNNAPTNLLTVQWPDSLLGRPHHPHSFLPRNDDGGFSYATYQPTYASNVSDAAPEITVALRGSLTNDNLFRVEMLPILPPEDLTARGSEFERYATHHGMCHTIGLWFEKERQTERLYRALAFATPGARTVGDATQSVAQVLSHLASPETGRQPYLSFDDFTHPDSNTVLLKLKFQASNDPLDRLAGREFDPTDPEDSRLLRPCPSLSVPTQARLAWSLQANRPPTVIPPVSVGDVRVDPTLQ